MFNANVINNTISLIIISRKLSIYARWHILLSLHTAAFHFVAVAVVLLACARGRSSEGYAHHCRAAEAAAYGVVESVHVFGQETPAYGTQGFYFFGFVGHLLSLAERYGRAVLQSDLSVQPWGGTA